tara:strand:+ start:436 stop:627 length:192 start_codon:yes stop_codon:yes gene_type:complete
MDKETLLRLAQPVATFALALSVATLPMTVKAYGETEVTIKGPVEIEGHYDGRSIGIGCIYGCN